MDFNLVAIALLIVVMMLFMTSGMPVPFSLGHCDPSNPDFLGSKRVYFCQQQHLVNIPWRQLCCDSDVSAYGEHFRKNRHSGRSV